MARPIRLGFYAVFLWLLTPKPVWAGMPSFTIADLQRSFRRALTDPAGMRVDAISFFLLCLLLSALAVQWTWNSFRKDFGWLPRLSYCKALGVIFLWGLVFVLVLTMISGARELMTPGAWEKTGLTYRVADGSADVERRISARFKAIEQFQTALLNHATTHKNAYPTTTAFYEDPKLFAKTPVSTRQRYVYVGGTLPNEDSWGEGRPLLYEPDTVGNDRLVLMSDGWILWMPAAEIERASKRAKP